MGPSHRPVGNRAEHDDEIARHRRRHQPQRHQLQHGEHDERGREQQLVRGRIEHARRARSASRSAWRESRRPRPIRAAAPNKAMAIDQLVVQQRQRYRAHQQNSERGDDVRDLAEPAGHVANAQLEALNPVLAGGDRLQAAVQGERVLQGFGAAPRRQAKSHRIAVQGVDRSRAR